MPHRVGGVGPLHAQVVGRADDDDPGYVVLPLSDEEFLRFVEVPPFPPLSPPVPGVLEALP